MQRREHRRAGSDDYPGLAAPGPLPLVVPLSGGQRAVKDRNLLSKVGGKHPQELRRQRDLRHQNQGASPPVQHLLDEADVHLGLAAAGYPVQESHGGLSLPAQPVQPLQSGLLLLIELRQGLGRHVVQLDTAEYLLLLQSEDAALGQGLNGGRGGSGEVTQFLGAGRTQLTKQLGHRVAQGCSLSPGSDQRHGLLRGHGQHRQLLCLVPHAPLGAGDDLGRSVLHQIAYGRSGVLGAKASPDLLQLPLSLPGQQHIHQFCGGGRTLGGLIGPLPVHGQLHAVPQGVVEPGGQHGLHRVIHRTKVPLPHPKSQLEAAAVQHRLLIQGGGDGL